jgi:metallo-beta-lactamase class B
MEPFHIVGNIYYVGVAGVSSFLITTPAGGILLDAGFPETAPLIEKSIVGLGFRIEYVKLLLNSHAHYDHAGGLAELKRRTGASLVVSEGDAPKLRKGEGSDFPAVIVDRTIHDRETVQLGDVKLTARVTPGHTKGCTTWTTYATEGGKTYDVVFYCSTTVVDRLVDNRGYPQIVTDYQRSFFELRGLPCDVFLAPHGSFFRLDEKRAKAAVSNTNPFIDSTELRTYVEKSERDFQNELNGQQRVSR